MKSINNMLKQINSDIKNYSELYKITHDSLFNIINGIQAVTKGLAVNWIAFYGG